MISWKQSHKPCIWLKNRKARLDSDLKTTILFWQKKSRSPSIRIMPRKSSLRRRQWTGCEPKHTASSAEHGEALWWFGHAWLSVAHDVTQDRTSRLNTEVFRDVLPAQIQPNEDNLFRWCFTIMGSDSKHTVKATQGFITVKLRSGISLNGQVSRLISKLRL